MVTPAGRAAVQALSRSATAGPSLARSLTTFASTSSLTPTSDPASSTHPRVQLLSFPPLTPLPRPYGIHTATLHLAAHHPHPLDLYTSFALHSAASLGIPTSNPASLPTSTSLYTVPKSPFVHKKAQENFERRTHRRVIKVWDADRGVIDLWLRYLKRNGLGGVGMKAYVFEWVDFGYAGRELGEVERALERGGAKADIQSAAEGLVRALGAEDDAVSAEQAEGTQIEKPGGQEWVEGSDDVVAGSSLPTVEPDAAGHEPAAKDGGGRAIS